MKRARAKASRKPVALQPGDLVLIGSPGITMPGDWFFAKVRWTEGADVLVEQYGLGGTGRFHQLHSIADVRAVGDVAFLNDFEKRCREEVRSLSEQVSACERALGAARDAVWSKLDEIGAAGPARQSGGEAGPA